MKKDIIDNTYNYLTVLSVHHKKGYNKYYLCSCICGNTTIVQRSHLTTGHTKSCGCMSGKLRASNRTRHGDAGSKLYKVYYGMLDRCCNPKASGYYKYGAKGITVCEIWKESYISFKTWAESSGYKEGLSLDRIDASGNYSPDNCRWADYRLQAMNKPKSVRNTSGFIGVTWNNHKQRWVARISLNGKRKDIGNFLTKEEAIEARQHAIANLNNLYLNEQNKYES